MHWSFWTCPRCGAPMERTMKSRDVWVCRFCSAAHSSLDQYIMDGWYPEPKAKKIPVDGDTLIDYEGFTIMLDPDPFYRVLVIDYPDDRHPLFPSGKQHVFASSEVKDALLGK